MSAFIDDADILDIDPSDFADDVKGKGETTITHLSFTRLKKLAHSPLALKRYIEDGGGTSDAMTAGTLLDVLLFTPHEYESKFFVLPPCDRRTKEGKVIYADAIQRAGDKLIISQADKDNADFLAESVRNNSTVAFHGLLHPDNFKYQVWVDFKYGGFQHQGIKDADGFDRNGRKVIWDLKRMGNASGEKEVRYQIKKMKYDLQAAIYSHPFDIKNEPVKYYIIAVDNNGFVTPFEITRDARNQAKIEWNLLLKAAHRLNFEGFDMGCEFWADHDGFFKL